MFNNVFMLRIGYVLSKMGTFLSTLGCNRYYKSLASLTCVNIFINITFRLINFNDHFHFSRATVKGSESHKKIDLSGNPILRLYYTSRVRIGIELVANLICLFFIHFRKYFLPCVQATNFGFPWFICFILAKVQQVIMRN